MTRPCQPQNVEYVGRGMRRIFPCLTGADSPERSMHEAELQGNRDTQRLTVRSRAARVQPWRRLWKSNNFGLVSI
jgi:hypothetical protein